MYRLTRLRQFAFALLCAVSSVAYPQGVDPLEYLDQLFAQHSKLIAAKDYSAARDVAVRSVDYASTYFGANDITVAFSLRRLSHADTLLGDYDSAVRARSREVEILRRTPEMPRDQLSATLLRLAQSFDSLERFADALPMEREAVQLLESAAPAYDEDLIQARNSLGRTLARLGQYSEAATVFEQALETSTLLMGADNPQNVNLIGNLTYVYNRLGRYKDAVPLERRALELSETQYGPDSIETAEALTSLAATFTELGLHSEALPLKQRSLDIREAITGRDHPDTAKAMNNLAVTYVHLAEYEKALPLQLESLRVREKTLGPDHTDVGQSLNNLATTYGYLGSYQQELTNRQRAIQITEAALGSEHPTVGLLLTAMASTLQQLERYDESIATEVRALRIFRAAYGEDHPMVANAFSGIGVAYDGLGKHDEAIVYFQQALAVRERTLGEKHPDVALAISNLASQYLATEHFEQALPLEHKALAICEETLGDTHPLTADRQVGLSLALALNGDLEAAILFAKMAVNTFQTMRERVSAIGEEELRGYTATVSNNYRMLAYYLTLTGRLPEAQLVLDMLKEEEQFEFLRRSAAADPRRTKFALSQEERSWIGRYKAIASRVFLLAEEAETLRKKSKQASLTTAEQRRLRQVSADLQVAQKSFYGFLDSLRVELAAGGPRRTPDLDETSQSRMRELKDLLGRLGEDTVLVQYFLTPNRVGMLLTTADAQVARYVTIDEPALNRQIAEFRLQLGDPRGDPRPSALALYKVLIEPVEEDLRQANAKTIMLSLDGALRYLPIGALFDGQQFLVERWKLPVYTAAARDRLGESADGKWRAAGLGVTKEWEDFAPLPGVRSELTSIIGTDASVLPGTVFLDEAFTADRLMAVSQGGFPVVHIASHFRFRPGTEADSFLLLGDGSHLTLAELRERNYRFDTVDLLTLSACETGLGGGRDAKGREIEGLGVLAQGQGAKAVIVSLWPVADESTPKLMTEMYRVRVNAGVDKAEALRRAQLLLLADTQFAHPYYWAPFVLMGNWK